MSKQNTWKYQTVSTLLFRDNATISIPTVSSWSLRVCLYSSSFITKVINSRSMRRAGNVTRSGKSRSAGVVFVEKPEVKEHLNMKERGREGVDGIYIRRLAVHSLTSWGTRNFWRRTLLQGRRVFVKTVSASYQNFVDCVYCPWHTYFISAVWWIQECGF